MCFASAADEDLMLFKVSRMASVEDSSDMSTAFTALAVDKVQVKSTLL